ncbi:LysE family transporter [Salmonella enterica]|nr:LysE family transporter [Salmonella enterica]
MGIEYFITVFIICLYPGKGVVYTQSATLGGGWKAGFWASVGCTIATVIHHMVAMAGLATVLHTSAVLFQTIKFSGVACLLWMAWVVLNDRGGLSVRPVTSVTPHA